MLGFKTEIYWKNLDTPSIIAKTKFFMDLISFRLSMHDLHAIFNDN